MLKWMVIAISALTTTGAETAPTTVFTVDNAPTSRPRSKMIFRALDVILAGIVCSSCE